MFAKVNRSGYLKRVNFTECKPDLKKKKLSPQVKNCFYMDISMPVLEKELRVNPKDPNLA